MIIGLVGKKFVGKDTVADILVEEFEFRRDSFAAPLKDACQIIFGFTSAQVHDPELKEVADPRWGFSPRHAMQVLGTEGIRDLFGADIWVKSLAQRVNDLCSNLVITDVRFLNEAAWIKACGGVLVEVYDDDNAAARAGQHRDGHRSETEQDRIECTHFIYNAKTGILEFREVVRNFYHNYLKVERHMDSLETPTENALTPAVTYVDANPAPVPPPKAVVLPASPLTTTNRVLAELLIENVTAMMNVHRAAPGDMFWQELLTQLELARQRLP